MSADDFLLGFVGPKSEAEDIKSEHLRAMWLAEDTQVHHVRGLKDLQRKGQSERPRWVQVMEARRPEALVACEKCHDDINADAPAHARGGGRP